jgi:hypothetical protein
LIEVTIFYFCDNLKAIQEYQPQLFNMNLPPALSFSCLDYLGGLGLGYLEHLQSVLNLEANCHKSRFTGTMAAKSDPNPQVFPVPYLTPVIKFTGSPVYGPWYTGIPV